MTYYSKPQPLVYSDTTENSGEPKTNALPLRQGSYNLFDEVSPDYDQPI
jgi:hypothetical protein